MVRKYTLLAILFIKTGSVMATIINVPADYGTIQEAIDNASEHDSILVAPGVYSENISFRTKNLFLTSEFLWDNDRQKILTTIIDGSQPVNADTASSVRIIGWQDSTTVVQGFTITGGEGTAWQDEHSAGIYREGGGIIVANSSPVIRFNLITGNHAVEHQGLAEAGGGGIRCGDGSPALLNNVIINNTGDYGAGIVLNYCGATISNNIIAGNEGGQAFGGGGLWINNTNGAFNLIKNNTIVGNKSFSTGGGINFYSVGPGMAYLANNIIYANSANVSPQIYGSVSSISVKYCTIDGGLNGEGNIDQLPLFSDTLFAFIGTSPCIDAGDTSVLENDVFDPVNPDSALMPSAGNLRNDMGAYGGPGATELTPFNLFYVATDKSRVNLASEGTGVPIQIKLIIRNGSTIPVEVVNIVKGSSLNSGLSINTSFPFDLAQAERDTLRLEFTPSNLNEINDTIRIQIESEMGNLSIPVAFRIIPPEALNTGGEDEKLITWPNPAHDILFIQNPWPESEVILTIRDMNGRSVISKKQVHLNESTGIDVASLVPGNYIALLTDKKGTTIISRFSKY